MGRFRFIGFILIATALIASLCLNVRHDRTGGTSTTIADTSRIIIYDTVPYYRPVPVQEKKIADIVAKLPVVPIPSEEFSCKEDSSHTESIISNDDLLCKEDSTEVVVPITQKVYADSSYTAYVSGYMANLDSLILYPGKEIVTIRQTAKPKRWSFGIQVGYGIPVSGRLEARPYIGVGITYNLFSF